MKDRRTFLGKQMVRFKRGRWYAAMIQFTMILILTIRSFDTEAIIGISQFWITVFAFPSGIIFMWLVGYIDDKYGLFRQQKEYDSQINPLLNRIDRRVEKIEKELDNEKA